MSKKQIDQNGILPGGVEQMSCILEQAISGFLQFKGITVPDESFDQSAARIFGDASTAADFVVFLVHQFTMLTHPNLFLRDGKPMGDGPCCPTCKQPKPDDDNSCDDDDSSGNLMH